MIRSFKSRLLSVWAIQSLTVGILYFALPGRVNIEHTAFQPDSMESTCMSFKMLGLNSLKQKEIILFLVKHFKLSLSTSCAGSVPPQYRPRLLLSFLMGVSERFGPAWSIYIPSIVIFFAIGYVFTKLLSNIGVGESKYAFLYFLLPFLALHIGWFTADMMTEGPAALFMLLMIYYWLARHHISLQKLFLLEVSFGVLSIFSRQVWGIIIAIWLAIIWDKYSNRKSQTIYSLIASIIGLSANYLAEMIGKSKFGSDFGKWTIFSALRYPGSAIRGLALGLKHDFVNAIKFTDFAFFIVLYFTLKVMSNKKTTFSLKFVLGVALLWGMGSVGEAYVADHSFGQDWRFFTFALILGTPFYLHSKASQKTTGISG